MEAGPWGVSTSRMCEVAAHYAACLLARSRCLFGVRRVSLCAAMYRPAFVRGALRACVIPPKNVPLVFGLCLRVATCAWGIVEFRQYKFIHSLDERVTEMVRNGEMADYFYPPEIGIL